MKKKLRKITALFLTFCLMAGLLAVVPPAPAYGIDAPWVGDGDSDSPYIIASVTDLVYLSDPAYSAYWDAYFQQTAADIDLTDIAWTPIGDSSTPFTGTYDGGGNTISNLTINDSTLEYVGLFGQVGSGANLMNIKLEGASVSSTKDFAFVVGALAGYNMGNVSECSSDGTVTGGGYARVGGLIGYNYGGTISQCSSDGTVTGEGESIGGLVGKNVEGTISQCSSSGTVIGGNTSTTGGLAGLNEGHITGGTSSADVIGGNGSIGGLVGCHWRTSSSLASIRESRSTGNVSVGEYAGAGGLVGYRYNSVASSISDMTDNSSTGLVTGGSSATLGGLIGSDYDISGTASIYTLDGIVITSTDHKTEYTVGEALDITGLVVTGEYIGNNTAVLPITTAHISGFNSSAPATGQELTVTYGLKTAIFTVDISWPGDGSGTETDPYKVATPQQLNAVRYYLNDNTVHFEQTADIDLSGYANWIPIGDTTTQFKGTYDGGGYIISNLTIDSDATYVGLFGDVGGTGVLTRIALEDADVRSTAATFGKVGILTGHNAGSISYSYSTGTVQANGAGADVGGLVALNEQGSISNCYSTADVVSNGTSSSAGGLIGFNEADTTPVRNCYSAGNVSGASANKGGLIGDGNYPVEGSYYDADASGQSDTGRGEPQSIADMKKQSTFIGWDFDTVWKIIENNSYPKLQWQSWTSDERIAGDAAAITWSGIKGSNSAENNITTNLTLSLTGTHGSTITWSSAPSGYISGTGAVTPPTDADKTVTLTATVSYAGGTAQTKSFTLTVKMFSTSSGGDDTGSGDSSPTAPQTPPPITQGQGSTPAVITSAGINKTIVTDAAGKTTETFTIQSTAATQISQARQEGKTSVQFNLASSQTAVTDVHIPADVLESATGLNVIVGTPNATLELPAALIDALTAAGKGLQLTVERGGEMADPEGGVVLGQTTEITTDITGTTQVTIPLEGITIPTDPAEREAFLNSLAVFTYHSDGETELITAEIIYDASGNPVSITFPVDKFSTFAVVKLSKRTVNLTIGSVAGSLNGLTVGLDAPAFVDSRSNRTLVPLRFIGEALGAKVEWHAATCQVTVIDGSNQIILTLDSETALVNGKKFQLDAAPVITPPGRTFLPLRFIGESLGARVDYNAATQRITIIREYKE
ncbi:MAG: stalk domain-containing protein [Clostridia bacterium]|jgi:hypothetical protein|nr:stalk domain-containing protein [Clostridia bacterium]